MGAVLFEGPNVELGGVAYTLAPLSFGALARCKGVFERVASNASANLMDLQESFVDVIHASLLRNHPELPRDAVAENLDWDSGPTLFRQVMQISLPRAEPGEPKAASPSGESTGT